MSGPVAVVHERQRQALVDRAHQSYRDYPHLLHEWDGWRLARLKPRERVWLFGTLLADNGEHLLIDPAGPTDGYVSAYLPRVAVTARVRADKLEIIT